MGVFVRIALLGLGLGVSTGSWALPPEFQSWTAERKVAYFLSQIQETPYEIRPSSDRLSCRQILGLRHLFSLKRSFTHPGDELPGWRTKFIHAYGGVAQVRMEMRSRKYTGMFSAGLVSGIIRISLAAPPGSAGFTPGMALKMPVTGHPSIDLHVMPSLDGQKDDHYLFSHPYTSAIGEPEKLATKILGAWFSLVVGHPNVLSLEHMARYTPDGPETRPIVAPHAIVFEPGDDIPGSPDSRRDFRDDLASIPSGKALFRIVAVSKEGEREELGWMHLSSRFVASSYGDQKLFFRHEHTDAPISLR